MKKYQPTIVVDAKSINQGKVPPSAIELENAIVGGLMVEPIHINEIKPVLSPNDFYQVDNQIIYETILEMEKRGASVDFITVIAELKRLSKLELAGGLYNVTQKTKDVVSCAHLYEWALIVKQKSLARQLAVKAYTIAYQAYQDDADSLDILDKTIIELQHLQQGLNVHRTVTIYDSAKATLEEMYKAKNNPKELLGLPTSIKKLDSTYEGWSAPDLIVIAAGPGEGKTTIALQSAFNVSQQTDEGVAFFSFEMKDKQLLWKQFSAILGKEIKDIRKGNLSSSEYEKLYSVTSAWAGKKFYIFDSGDRSVFTLISNIRRIHAKYGIKIAYIDYLQLLNAVGSPLNYNSRTEELSIVTKALKSLCMELNICIIALSQVTTEKEIKRMYSLNDLKDSRAIGQDADFVIFVFRPHKHNLTQLKVGGYDRVFAEDDAILIIDKCRLGTTGLVYVKFDGAANKFYEVDSQPALQPAPLQVSSPNQQNFLDDQPF